MSDIHLEELTISRAHQAFKDGQYTAEALVTAYLARIQQLDQSASGPGLNSLVTINKDALGRARELDSALKETGEFAGPLHGVPIVVKDHVLTRGITTTFGSVLSKDFVPDKDATAVTKLHEAGAIILAKASLPDFGTDFFSTSTAGGTVRNPYALDRDTGASSSGTAAAVAANLCLVGIGSDSAGSIRIPAAFCNVVGFRPTVGLISGHGCLAGIVGQSTLGPVARTVRDAALVVDVLAGFDEEDQFTSVHARARAPDGGSYVAGLDAVPAAKRRVGVIRALFGGEGKSAEIDAVNGVINSALKTIEATGVAVVDVEVPDLKQHIANSSLFLSRSRHDLNVFLKAQLGVSLEEIASTGKHPPENVMIPYVAKYGSESPHDNPAYGKQVDAREELDRLMQFLMVKHGISAFVFPAVQIPAPRYAEIDVAMRSGVFFNSGLASQLRWPSICVPAGFTASGLPVGMEITGPPLWDEVLLGLGRTVEVAVQGRRAPKL